MIYRYIKIQKRNIFEYFTKKTSDQSPSNPNGPWYAPCSSSISPSKAKRSKLINECTIEPFESKASYYERDPGKQILILQYPLDKQDEVWRAHIDIGPCRPIYKYPYVKFGAQNRWFQSTWFTKHPRLEFSMGKESAFCFPCYLFKSNTS